MSAPRPDQAAIARGYELAMTALLRGENMVQTLAAQTDLPKAVIIEIAYALQSGSYTKGADSPAAKAYRTEVHGILDTLITENSLTTLLDAGIGEATMWRGFETPIKHLTGLDLSHARLTWAKDNLKAAQVEQVTLVKGDMGALPFGEAQFDLVVTMHAIEPNPTAAPLLEGLSRCASRFLVLLEPNYREAGPEQRARMEAHGYAQDTWDKAEALAGFDVIDSFALDHPVRAENATFALILRRREPAPATAHFWQCPVQGRPLVRIQDGLMADDGGFFYPHLSGIQMAGPNDGLFAGAKAAKPV